MRVGPRRIRVCSEPSFAAIVIDPEPMRSGTPSTRPVLRSGGAIVVVGVVSGIADGTSVVASEVVVPELLPPSALVSVGV